MPVCNSSINPHSWPITKAKVSLRHACQNGNEQWSEVIQLCLTTTTCRQTCCCRIASAEAVGTHQPTQCDHHSNGGLTNVCSSGWSRRFCCQADWFWLWQKIVWWTAAKKWNCHILEETFHGDAPKNRSNGCASHEKVPSCSATATIQTTCHEWANPFKLQCLCWLVSSKGMLLFWHMLSWWIPFSHVFWVCMSQKFMDHWFAFTSKAKYP